MREIKFRAWVKAVRRQAVSPFMQYFTLEDVRSDGFNNQGIKTAKYEWLADLEDCEIMQYTGLKDKNGREIYEGDILQTTRFNWKELGHPSHKTNLTNICYVFWDEERLAFRADGKFKGGGGFGWGFPIADDRADKTEIEVIGDIYSSPELMEVG